MKGLLNSNIKARYTRLYTFVYDITALTAWSQQEKKQQNMFLLRTYDSLWLWLYPCGFFFLHFILSEIIPIKNVVSALFTEYSFNKLWCLHALMQNSVTCIKVMTMLSIFSLSHVFDQLPENGYVSLVQHSSCHYCIALSSLIIYEFEFKGNSAMKKFSLEAAIFGTWRSRCPHTFTTWSVLCGRNTARK